MWFCSFQGIYKISKYRVIFKDHENTKQNYYRAVSDHLFHLGVTMPMYQAYEIMSWPKFK